MRRASVRFPCLRSFFGLVAALLVAGGCSAKALVDVTVEGSAPGMIELLRVSLTPLPPDDPSPHDIRDENDGLIVLPTSFYIEVFGLDDGDVLTVHVAARAGEVDLATGMADVALSFNDVVPLTVLLAPCGDGVVDPGEDCDGVNLQGETCQSLSGFSGGILSCSPLCAFDTSGCSDEPRCNDGLDNDGDGFTDFPEDPSCLEETGVESAFDQQVAPAATILWVIDNSGSMCEEQENLQDNIPALTGRLDAIAPGVPYRMGVITTDTLNPSQSGILQNVPSPVAMTALCPMPPLPPDCTTGLPNPLPKWVDRNTPERDRMFSCLASVGVSGFGAETPLGAARMALSPALLTDPTANDGFLIGNSLLVLVFIGDEGDCSVCAGDVCGPLPNLQANLDCSINRVNELTPVAELSGFFSTIPNISGVVTAAFLGADPVLYSASCLDGMCTEPVSAGPIMADPGGTDLLVPICSDPGQGDAVPAPRVEELVRDFPTAREFSICDADFSNELTTLAETIGTRIGVSEVCLAAPPCPGATPTELTVHVVSGGVPGPPLAPALDYDLLSVAMCPGGFQLSLATPLLPTESLTFSYPVSPGC